MTTNPKVILIVDNEELQMQYYINVLEMGGFKVFHCLKADLIVKMVNKTNPDLIILDMMMPPGRKYKQLNHNNGLWTGRLVLEDLMKSNPDKNIIIFSQIPRSALNEWIPNDKVSFVSKLDYSPSQLLSFVQNIFPELNRNIYANKEKNDLAENEKTMRILFLAANPFKTSPLDLEEELRNLEFELRGVTFRESISLISKHAVRPDDLIRHIRTYKPNIVHFSGHGTNSGIVLRSDNKGFSIVSGESLRRFLEGRGVDLVFLNACYSKEQSNTIGNSTKVVIGTTDAVGDEAARRFTVAFYRALGEGLSIREAFRDGGDSVALHGLNDVFHCDGDVDIYLTGQPID
jgi:CheY-like chemotaxis protein